MPARTRPEYPVPAICHATEVRCKYSPVRGAVSVLLSVVVLASACAPGPDEGAGEKPAKPGPSSGECYAGSHEDLGDFEPDYATKVPCSAPHLWEITGVIDIPSRLLDRSSPDASLKRRAELAGASPDGSPLQKQFSTFIVSQCRRALADMTGLTTAPRSSPCFASPSRGRT